MTSWQRLAASPSTVTASVQTAVTVGASPGSTSKVAVGIQCEACQRCHDLPWIDQQSDGKKQYCACGKDYTVAYKNTLNCASKVYLYKWQTAISCHGDRPHAYPYKIARLMVIWHRAARQFPGRYRSVLPDRLSEKPPLLLCCVCCFPNTRLVKLTELITRVKRSAQPFSLQSPSSTYRSAALARVAIAATCSGESQ